MPHFKQLRRLSHRLEQVRQAEEGATLVYLALVLLVLLGFAALAIDGSNVYLQRRRMQTAADAAALAGARSMALNKTNSQVSTEIQSLATTNGAEIGTLNWGYISDNTGVQVTTQKTFDTYFARVLGFDDLTVSASSRAEYQPVKKIDKLFPMAVNCDCVEFGSEVTFENSVVDSELESCTYNLNVKPGQTFNIRDYIHYKDSNQPVDWSQVLFTYTAWGANDPTSPSDWHLSDFNSGLSVTVSAADAANGTGNRGKGRYRVYFGRVGQDGYDDHMEIRIQSGSNNINSAKCPTPVISTNPCKFTWLDWDGAPTTDSELFENFSNHSYSGPWQVGDWVPSGPPEVTNLQCVNQLDYWLDRPVTIPLYDEILTDGTYDSSTDYPTYQICGFAQFTMTSYDFGATPRWLTGVFKPGLVRGQTSEQEGDDFGLRNVHLLEPVSE